MSTNFLQAGKAFKICDFSELNPRLIKTLLAIGILPSMEIKILQVYPSVLIKTEESIVAIDRETASLIIAGNSELKQ